MHHIFCILTFWHVLIGTFSTWLQWSKDTADGDEIRLAQRLGLCCGVGFLVAMIWNGRKSHDFLMISYMLEGLYVYESEVKNGQPQKENLRMVQILSLKMVMTWGWWLWHWVYWAYHIKWWCCWGWLGKARNHWESPWLAIYFERATRSEADQRERNLPFFLRLIQVDGIL